MAPAQDRTAVDRDRSEQDHGHDLPDQVNAEWSSQRTSTSPSISRDTVAASTVEADDRVGVRSIGDSGPAPREMPSRDGADRLRPRPIPDVRDLMDPGRRVADRLSAHGVTLSRSVLIKGLRTDGVRVSTDRATALLAALRADGPINDAAVLPSPQD